ncbi:MAG: uL30 family ribosomal protein [Nanoarchaeota archaeon]|nr:uL30 family ribosomal protein [Nanoarchaeota archaeon]
MIAIIRITGQINLSENIKETFQRLNLKKKYTCIVIEEMNDVQKGMLKKIKDFVAYGELNKETYDKLVEKRGQKEKNIFRLHPARGGINTKKAFPKGVLGNHKQEINKLVERML